jgi:molybdopterin-guanine dinucleotide biosynthesis protein A
MRVGGIILCGGQSKRMGRPKAWLPFGAETMLARLTRILGQGVAPIVVVGARGQALPRLPSAVVRVEDEQVARGPLQGLHAGLEALGDQVDAAFVSGCDAPFLRSALIQRLVDLMGDASICVPHTGGFHHALAAVYRVEVAVTVQQLLEANNLQVSLLFDRVPTRIVEANELVDIDPTLQSLRNCNTLEEYERALREIESAIR